MMNLIRDSGSKSRISSTRHDEPHYKRMAAEMLRNIQLIAGDKLGHIIFQNIVTLFTSSSDSVDMASLSVGTDMPAH